MKYEKCIGMPVKRGCQKVWCVLDYIHPRTVKGKNFNGIKALRKKAEVLSLGSKIPAYVPAAGRAPRAWIATPKHNCIKKTVA